MIKILMNIKKVFSELKDAIVYIILLLCAPLAIKERLRLNHNSKKERVIHIIANGPSLNNTIKYVDQIGGDIMMVNGGAMALKDEYRPKYYCLADPLYFVENLDDESIAHLEAINSYKHDLEVLIPAMYKQIAPSVVVHKIKYVNSLSINISKKYANKLYKKNIIVPVFFTVTNMALYSALQLGYNKIYLHGTDMTWLNDLTVDENNVVWTKYSHFYGDEYKEWGMNYLKSIDCLYRAMDSFYKLRDYADYVGASIINMSTNSIVDCFEKNKTDK